MSMKLSKRYPDVFAILLRILDLHGKIQSGWKANADGTWSGASREDRHAMAEQMVALRRKLAKAIARIPREELESLDDWHHLQRQTACADETADDIIDELDRSRERSRR